MSIAFDLDGTKMSCESITPMMAELRRSEVSILFATMVTIDGPLQFPPMQMQVVLHLRGTSQQTLKASEMTWSARLAFSRSDGGC